MELVLIRHAQPHVEPGVCYGRLDLPLADPMFPCVESLAQALDRHGSGRPARIIASPARRASETARLLAAAIGHADVEHEPRLREVDFGEWEGRRWDDLPREGLDQWAADLMHACPHGGETTGAAWARVAQWADEMQAHADRAGCVWVVCHAGPMRMLAAHWLRMPLTATLDWQLGWGASCAFRLLPSAPSGSGSMARLLWWNRVPA